MTTINVTINGKVKELSVNINDKLLDVLRRYGYKSVHKGCNQGECGACVVKFNGKPVNSCMVPVMRADGAEIITVEGLGTMDKPHPIQTAMVETGGVQCGFCTPGFIISAEALIAEKPSPTLDEIKRATDGNLCRCTGYVKKLDGIQLAAKRMKGGKK